MTAATIADPRSMSGACHHCEHRRDLPGNTHSACRHPATEAAHRNPLAGVISAMGGALPLPVAGLTVVGDPHSIRMGWFAHPFNFSPTWLVTCDGFAPKEIEGGAA